MSLSHISKAVLLLATAAQALNLPQNIPPKANSDVRMLGKTKDPNFNVNIYRDGGSSVYANGYHMMIFADTIVDKFGPTPMSQLTSHNSLAYFGYDSETDPTIMHDFGSQTPHTMDNVLEAPMATKPNSNETAEFGIWPSSNMAVLSDGVTAVGMFPMFEFATSLPVYSTLVTVKVEDPKSLGNNNPTTERLVDQFFYENEPMYGGLSIIRGLDGLFYMYASVPTGVKVARVSETDMTDRGKYEFWDGSSFQSEMPSKDDTKSNVLQFSVSSSINGQLGPTVGPDVGDVFWSDFHKTYLMLFMDATVNGQYWIAYSPDASLTKWSKPEKLWAPFPNPTWTDECNASGMQGKWNYGGHAHPHWDPSGKTLLISWASCTVWVNMAVITWEGSDLLSGLKGLAETNEPSSSGSETSAAPEASTPTATAVSSTTAAESSTPTSTPSDSSESGSSSDEVTGSMRTSVLSLGPNGAVRYRAVPASSDIQKRDAEAEDRSKFMLRRRQDWRLPLTRDPNF